MLALVILWPIFIMLYRGYLKPSRAKANFCIQQLRCGEHLRWFRTYVVFQIS